jgi:hypothetical protein
MKFLSEILNLIRENWCFKKYIWYEPITGQKIMVEYINISTGKKFEI